MVRKYGQNGGQDRRYQVCQSTRIHHPEAPRPVHRPVDEDRVPSGVRFDAWMVPRVRDDGGVCTPAILQDQFFAIEICLLKYSAGIREAGQHLDFYRGGGILASRRSGDALTVGLLSNGSTTTGDDTAWCHGGETTAGRRRIIAGTDVGGSKHSSVKPKALSPAIGLKRERGGQK